MKYIEENNVFTEDILLLELDTPVKGYDGTDIGPANEQAQALANRTLWLKDKLSSLTPNELNVVEVESEKANIKYIYPTPTDYHFDHSAWVFKDIMASQKRTETIDYSTEAGSINQSELPASNEEGFFNYKDKENFAVATESDESEIEKYESDEISDYLIGAALATATVEKGTNNVVPVATQNQVDEFTLISSTPYSGFDPWKAFQSPLTESESKRVGNYQYWSDNQIWEDRKNEVWLGIKSDTAFEISGYEFQNFESLYWSNLSTPPTEWELQGRNTDDDTWTDIDYQVDQTIMKSGNGWSRYLLTKSVSYKQYRILIKNVVLQSARASIPRMQFLTEPSVLIKGATGTYFTINEDNALTTVDDLTADSFKELGFKDITSPIELETLADQLPIKLVSIIPGTVDIELFETTYQITTHNPLPETMTWEGLLTINPTKYETEEDETEIKMAFSVDNKNYMVIENGEWIDIGELTLTEESAKLLTDRGQSLNTISAIESTQWEDLLGFAEGDSAVFGVAYAKAITNKKESTIPSEVQFSFDEIRYWQQMSLDKVQVFITKDFITFKPLEKGKYKFCYRFN